MIKGKFFLLFVKHVNIVVERINAMKKIFLLFGVLLCASFLFCEELTEDIVTEDPAYVKVDEYLSDNFSSRKLSFLNQGMVFEELNILTDEQKADLYEQHSRSGAGYFGLNMVLPGLGSYIQGDAFGGTIELVMGIAGMGLTTYGLISSYINIIIGIIEGVAESASGSSSTNSVNVGPALGSLFVGLGIIVADLIFSIVRPFKYSKSINASLDSLLFNNETQISIAPVISTTAGFDGVTVGMSVRL